MADDTPKQDDGGAPPARGDGSHELDLAAVDLGSNSFHMLVARIGSDGLMQVIDRLREPVRLAGGLDSDLRLSVEARERALRCLARFGERIQHLPKRNVRVVGTNTLREMHQGFAFIETAEAALGHNIEVISGAEEARLVYEGVTRGLEADQRRRLVVDIGGGSTELVIGDAHGPRFLESVALGCVVHTQRFFEDGNITRKRFQAARLAARVELEYLERQYREAGWDIAIGSSGTVRGIWRVLMAYGWCDDEITREGLEQLIDVVIATGRISAIKFEGLREDRRPVFPGGVAALAGVFDSLGIERMRTSDRALREGLIYDICERNGGDAIRSESVLVTARRYGVDEAHARDVADTARHALAQVVEPWGLQHPQCERLLEWAALLHEVGLSVSHASYHKHGEYILRNMDIQGFSQTEQKLVSVLVRLHRGKLSSSVLDGVPGSWAQPIKRLAILLRLAYLLNRSRKPGVVPAFALRATRNGLHLELPGRWLENNPLTCADLEREAGQLKAAGYRLSFR
ncbi:exopolyphosphatase [Algiphilus sp.]|uniref:Ppx/GppA phosphatase family protein n=1 Tax=Algiphilus sp. TaxID=1872431 RepID=UPI003B5174C4